MVCIVKPERGIVEGGFMMLLSLKETPAVVGDVKALLTVRVSGVLVNVHDNPAFKF